MSKILAIARRELQSSFSSPLACGIVIFFVVFPAVWLFYAQGFFLVDQATLRPYFAIFPVVFTLVVPALTMRTWAEERRLGTIELLFSLPCTEMDLVLAKFLASLGLISIALLLTIPLPLSLMSLGDFDGGVIVSEYLGTFLLAAASLSIGQFASTLARHQVGAFLLSLVALFLATSLSQLSLVVSLPAFLAHFLNAICLSFHYERFTKGVVDIRDVLWYGLFTFFFLYAASRVILFRKWR